MEGHGRGEMVTLLGLQPAWHTVGMGETPVSQISHAMLTPWGEDTP